MNGITILSVGKALPCRRMTNQDMAGLVDTSDEWISTRTGIRQRYFCGEDETVWSLASRAARLALERASVDPARLAACVVATMSPAFATPSTACLVQRELGLPEDVLCFDLNAACSGFVFSLETVRGLVSEEKPYALIIGAESLSRITDFSDRSTCVLFGDGAGAVVVAKSNAPFAAVHGARGNDQSLICPAFGSAEQHLRMDGRAVFRFAVDSLPRCINGVLAQSGLTQADVDYFVCHQANRRILDHVIKDMKADSSKFYMNLSRYGNTSAASIPLALADMDSEGLLRPGTRLVCAGFGGGFTWGGVLLCWNEEGDSV